jgi:site-specific recombinase XerD
MKAGLDYRTIGRNAKGELEFFSSKPKLSTKPKRAIGKGLTRAEKEFSWNWYQNCAGIGSQTTDMYIRALREFSGRKDGKSTDLMVLKSYFSYGNTEQSRDAYINLKPFSLLANTK